MRHQIVRINGKLYEHQKKAYDFGCRQFGLGGGNQLGKGLALLMDMGTGKTITTIAIAGTMFDEGKIKKMLVVAPLTILDVWQDEYRKWADYNYSLAVLSGAKRVKADILRHMTGGYLQVAVVNYDSVESIEEELKNWDADIVVCDEATKIMNPTNSCSKVLYRLGKRSRYNIILTGSPIANSVLDWFGMYKFLDSSIFGESYLLFKEHYATLGGYNGNQIVDYKSMPELLQKAHSVAYRVRLEDAVELPETMDDTRYVSLDPLARRIYEDIEKHIYNEFKCGGRQNLLTDSLRLCQLAGGFIDNKLVSTAKLKALSDIIDSLISEEKKIVIFARFINEIESIKKLMRDKKLKYSCITGEIKDRKRQVDNFQNDSNTKVFIGQIATCGMGITLHSASVAIYYSLDYSYSNYIQSKARIHRIGQKNMCLYIHLIAKNTIDESIMYRLNHKGNTADFAVDEYLKKMAEKYH